MMKIDTTTLPRSHASRSLAVQALIASVLAVLLVACGGSDKPKVAKPVEQAAGPDTGRGVIVLDADETARAGIKEETLALRSTDDTITVTATIRPDQDRIARVAPRVEGRIVTVSASLGDVVKSGQALALMDSVAIGEAHSSLQQAQSARRVAEADFKRAETLIADEIIPQRDYLRARSDLERSSAEQRAAEDKLRLLGGGPASGRGGSTFQLRAPLTGTIVEKKATVGELHTPSEPLFTIADLSVVWIEADLTEDALSKVQKGAAATVTVKAYPGELFSGRVTYLASLLDKDTRTIPARIEVDNKDGRLKPEMFAIATITTTGARKDVLSVPDAAVVLMQGQPSLFVAERGGFATRVIEVGEKLSGRTTIRSGVEAGERVVTAGAYALKARALKSQIGDAH